MRKYTFNAIVYFIFIIVIIFYWKTVKTKKPSRTPWYYNIYSVCPIETINIIRVSKVLKKNVSLVFSFSLRTIGTVPSFRDVVPFTNDPDVCKIESHRFSLRGFPMDSEREVWKYGRDYCQYLLVHYVNNPTSSFQVFIRPRCTSQFLKILVFLFLYSSRKLCTI